MKNNCRFLALLLLLAQPAWAQDYDQLAKDIFRELIEIDTTHSTGDTAIAAQKMADRLLAAGFDPADVRVIENAPRKGNLVARLRGANPGAKPVLFLAHIDVVEADPADWSFDPFKFLEQEDHYYGRGTLDDKDEAAIYVTNLIRMMQEGFVPDRDLVIALTADEEGGPENGVRYLLTQHRDLVDAAFVVNEGGGGRIIDGEHATNAVQTAEKVYQSYALEVTNPGGHSSRPRADNAIYQLAHALRAIEAHEFPVMLNETTRAMFEASASTLPPRMAEAIPGLLQAIPSAASIQLLDKDYAALLRTTCVATQLQAGHAENALPQRAQATINCRILPGVDPGEVKDKLITLIDDAEVSIMEIEPPTPSDPSPLTEEVMGPIHEITEDMWPGVAVIPSMSTGATDGLFFRNAGIPVYGVSGIFYEQGENRAHGRDERILKSSFYDGLEFLYRLMKAYGRSSDSPEGPTPL